MGTDHRPACLYIIEDFSIPFGEEKKMESLKDISTSLYGVPLFDPIYERTIICHRMVTAQ